MEAATATAGLESFSPATGELVGSVPITAPGEVQAAVDAVAKVQPFWAQLTLRDRALVDGARPQQSEKLIRTGAGGFQVGLQPLFTFGCA